MIPAEAMRRIEELNRQLKEVTSEEDRLKSQMETVLAKKTALLSEIRKLSNEDNFTAEALSMVYEQRHKK